MFNCRLASCFQSIFLENTFGGLSLKADNFIYGFQIIFCIFVINYSFEDFLRLQFFCNLISFYESNWVTESFFSNHASLSFHMMHKIPGTIFSLSVSTETLWFLSLTKHFFYYTFHLDEERWRAHFSKYCKSYFSATPINSFTYIMSEAAVPSFTSYSCLEHLQQYRRKSPYVSNELQWKFTFNWIFCVYSLS